MKEKFKIKIFIRQNKTGLIRQGTQESDHEFSDYMWTDGNYACDCNRESFFEEYGNEPETNQKCSNGRYDVKIKDMDGNILYEEY